MEFLQYFGGVFEPFSFSLLLFGTIGGLVLGATPGLSPTMAVALLIPFTFQLQPTHGLILLGAAYTATVAGGAVSAILLRIPGAPANIATALDGHEMAKKGEGAKALHASFLASGVGGIIGVLLLIFLTPVLAKWALAFGYSHLFWMAIVGVTIIGSLDSKSFVKGLLSGCLGFWLSLIGYDDIQGAQRFIFHDALTGGVNVITALIGIFAVPQIIDMFAKGRQANNVSAIVVEKQKLGDSLGLLFKQVKALSIGTVVGSVVGLIPGVGGQIAGLVSYDQSKKFSETPELFGTGHPEGVIAAESANNAMVGPSLVPLLTLSIPGSPTAAVLLGGLLIHGIFPGSDLFESHPQVAWTFINSMLIGQVLMVFFGIWIASYAARVAQVPSSIMASSVMVLAIFGAYSVQQSMGDVYIMAALGIGMFCLEKFGFSAAPLVLGLILGPIAENNFITGSLIANAMDGPVPYFLFGPLNILLIALVIASIVYSFLMSRREAANELSAAGTAETDVDQKGGPMNTSRLQHLIPGLSILLLAAAVTYTSYTREPADAFLFPRLVATVMLVLAIWNFIRAASGLSRVGTGFSWHLAQSIAPGLLVLIVYVFFAAKYLGFYAASLATFFVLYSLYDPGTHKEGKVWLKRLVISVSFMLLIYALFTLLLKVQTPRGIFDSWIL